MTQLRMLTRTCRPLFAVKWSLVLMLVAPLCLAQLKMPQSKAVLIIDDMGNSLPLGQRALQLPGKINFSFLPHTPNARELAEQAHKNGREVMLHLPMSNLNGAPTGPGKLSPIMDQQQFSEVLESNLQSIPYARGVNNHMGSLLTQLQQPMQWLMSELKSQRLYFIDSRTSPLTVAARTASAEQVPVLSRDVFLDNELDPEKIAAQVERWIQLSRSHGTAVAIAHPHPQTLAVLEQVLPTLQQRGVQLNYASEILNQRLADSNAASEVSDPSPVTAKN